MLFIGISITLGQNINPYCQDGKLYFKIKGNQPIPFSVSNGVVDLKNTTFFGNTIELFNVKSVKNPFYTSKNEVLDRIFLIDFLETEKIDDFIQILSTKSQVQYAEKAPYFQITYKPNDPNYTTAANNWHLKKIWADTAWNITKGDTNIMVAVIDNAIFVNHPDLVGKVKVAIDLADGDNDPTPPTFATAQSPVWSHGTHTSGLVGATSDNGVGNPSIGYDISLMAIKAGKDADGGSGATHMYEGINYAADNGARVISMSLGGPLYFETMQLIIDYAYNKGCVIVAAAGNNGAGDEDQNNVNYIGYPAACNHVIAVGATNGNDKKASFSEFGTWIDVVAPGGFQNDGGIIDVLMNNSVYSTAYSSATGGYVKMQGTSMACPIVAGLCGLMLSVDTNLTPDRLTHFLKLSCDNIESLQVAAHQGMVGAGRINAYNAVKMVQDSISTLICNFSANSNYTAPNTSINFTDHSIGAPTAWLWTFEGGAPETSTEQNPEILYENAGSFMVTLMVTTDADTSIEVKSNFITVTTPSQGSSDWHEQATGFASMYRGAVGISIANPNVAWISVVDGTSGLAINEFSKTVNGGTLWAPGVISNAPAGYSVAHIQALDENKAFVALYPTSGGGGKVFHTSDGGTVWEEIPTGAFTNTASFLDVVHFFNDNDGFVVGDPVNSKFEILYTSDGGANWTSVDAAGSPAILSGEMAWTGMYEVIGNTVWFGTNKGRIFKSTDKGHTWAVLTTGMNDIQKITFSDENNGLIQQIAYNQTTGVISTFKTKFTQDGGTTWTLVTPSGPIWKGDISAVPGFPGRYFSVGSDGAAQASRKYGSSYSTNYGLSWNLIDTTVQYICVKFLNENSGWAGGFSVSATSGGIYKWIGEINVTAIEAPKNRIIETNVYPNPFNDYFNIELYNLEKCNVVTKIYDLTGKLIHCESFGQMKGNARLNLNVGSLPKGMYILNIEAGSERVSKKIVRQ